MCCPLDRSLRDGRPLFLSARRHNGLRWRPADLASSFPSLLQYASLRGSHVLLDFSPSSLHRAMCNAGPFQDQGTVELLPPEGFCKLVGTSFNLIQGGCMRLFGTLALHASACALSGCTVPTTYSKSISVRNAVVETVEIETIVQPGQGYPVRFEHLQAVQPSASSQEAIEKSHMEFRRSK